MDRLLLRKFGFPSYYQNIIISGFALIFYFNFQCFLCLHWKTKTNKIFRRFIKYNSWILKIFKNQFCYWQIFDSSNNHKPTLGSCKVPLQIWAWSLHPFWRLLDTNKQRQTSKVYIYIDMKTFQISVFCAIYFRRTGMSISPLNQVLIYVMLCYVMLCYVMLSRKIVLSLKWKKN